MNFEPAAALRDGVKARSFPEKSLADVKVKGNISRRLIKG